MKRNRLGLILAVGVTLATETYALARVPGGAPKGSCYATFEGIDAVAGNPNRVECVDGEACDADGLVNNQCTFDITVCAFQTDPAGLCTPKPITKFRGNGTKLLNVNGLVGATSPTCAQPSTGVTLQLRGKHKMAKKVIQLTAQVSGGAPKSDKNKITLVCRKSGTTTTTLPACPNNPDGGPRQLDYTVADNGTDLDTGFTGTSHNFPVIAGAHLSLCLTGCNGCNSPVCKAAGPTGNGSLNGATFGPPLPLFAASVATCVVNNFKNQGPTGVQATVNLATGQYDSMVDGTSTPIELLSDVYVSSPNQVCPQCKNGTCDSGPNQGRSCTEEGSVPVRNPNFGINTVYHLSSSCPPGGTQASKAGTVPVSLPVTTGTDSRTGKCPAQQSDDGCSTLGRTCSVHKEGLPDVKGGFNQWCCDDQCGTPCFPTASNSGEPNHAIVRMGTPLPPSPACPDSTFPKTGAGAKVVATFCISSTGSNTVDTVAGLPGPGAVIFNGTYKWLGNNP